MNRLRQFWWQRTGRERRGLLAAALVLVAGASYGLLWQPLEAARLDLAKSLPAREQALRTLRAQASEVAGLPAQPKAAPTTVERETLSRRAQAHGLTLALPQGESLSAQRLSLHLPAAPFERVLAFLEALRREGGWQVAELRLAKVSPNLVNADVVLIRE